MIIVGEKINGTLKKVKNAIQTRDADFIKELAILQTEAGANFLDVNAGTSPDREPDDLVWLVNNVQEAVDTPLCLDSTNNDALEAALNVTTGSPLINSISGEPFRIDVTLPLACPRNCPVIALALDEKGIPKDAQGRVKVIREVIEQTRKAGMPDDQVYVDPLASALATDISSGQVAWETMRTITEEFPEVKFAVGLSNISFGMPARALVNQAFLSLCMAQGLDMAIMDPMNKGLMESLYATQAVLGKDRFCMKYTKAFKAGIIGDGLIK